MESSGDSKNVDVRPSPIEGLGIFARRAFEPGDYIDPLEYEREVTEDCPINPELGERVEHCVYPDGKMMLIAFPGRHMNHSCDPNAYYHYEGSEAKARARRAIAIGEEITVDYLINNPGGNSWVCNCGSSRCRGETGTAFFHLPTEFQREYYSLLAPWFKQRFQKDLSRLEPEA